MERGDKDIQALWKRNAGSGAKQAAKRNPKIFNKRLQKDMRAIHRNFKRQASTVDAALVDCKEAMKEEQEARKLMADQEAQMKKKGRVRRLTGGDRNTPNGLVSTKNINLGIR